MINLNLYEFENSKRIYRFKNINIQLCVIKINLARSGHFIRKRI